MAQNDQVLSGRYRILDTLGAGGMATVYLAQDTRLGRRVAVKLLHDQFANDPAFVSRFEDEARMAASLSHPNIVQVYDVGQDSGRHYIVMEYVAGPTLKEEISRVGALPVGRTVAIAVGILAALEFAHTHDLIHRDVKAQNILLPVDGGVKVTDFGIARELSNDATKTLTAAGMVIGTAHYFSPEQAQGHPATTRSDVYSVGIIMYEMLTGVLPFEGDNPVAVAMKQISSAPVPPSTKVRGISPALEAIVLKAMQKNPANRYASGSDMGGAVRRLQLDSPQDTRILGASTPIAGATTVNRVVAAPKARPARSSRLGNAVLGLLATLVAIGAFAATFKLAHDGGFSVASKPTPTASATMPAIVPITPTNTATPKPKTPTPTITPSPTDTPTVTIIPTATSTATSTPSVIPTVATTTSPTAGTSSTPGAQSTGSPTVPTSSTGAASISLSPAQGSSGMTVTIAGMGWPSGTTVTLSANLGNNTQNLASPTATNGAFSSTFTVPAGTAPGEYEVDAQDTSGHTASATLGVQ